MSRYARKKPPLHFEEGIFIDKTTVTSGGKTQIPAVIRRKLQIQDGHEILWFEKNGDIIIKPSTPWGEEKTARS
jgi:AbrB family looped-hinge helix DNA binding protein